MITWLNKSKTYFLDDNRRSGLFVIGVYKTSEAGSLEFNKVSIVFSFVTSNTEDADFITDKLKGDYKEDGEPDRVQIN